MSVFVAVKKLKDLPVFDGVVLDFEVENDNVVAVIIKSGENVLKIKKAGQYSDFLSVLTHKKKEYVDAYQLSVLTVEGLSLVETFASESEANSKLESLKYDYSLSEFSIIKVSKEVEPENLGEVKLDIPF